MAFVLDSKSFPQEKVCYQCCYRNALTEYDRVSERHVDKQAKKVAGHFLGDKKKKGAKELLI